MKTMILAATLIAAPLAAQTQAQMGTDAGTAARAADAAMNAQYRQTMAAMQRTDSLGPQPDAKTGPNYQNALLAAQRAWLAYRDAECRMQGYEFRGGSAQGMAHAQCVADLTRARTKQLKVEMWAK